MTDTDRYTLTIALTALAVIFFYALIDRLNP